ncbi:putative late blight resistance protein homolog R1B-16 [Ipomoea triloba]|uniref:putative late blight resistance protein homolog R1B-16 n=1 Tax=Ipomoea triloba TaxID=35885 RepID=UPI00125D38B1|nr:putative late blight resistance protein homolog R1B-16 [Ipomoea triloba]
MPNISNQDNDIVVGFKKAEETIINQLINGSKEREVVLISGMGGLGKTTFVRGVYEEKNVANHFDKRAWCTVSQEYDCKDLMNKIYSQVCGSEITMRSSVAEELCKRLMGMRYLIVLDDIWSVEAWEELNRVFPECDNGSRIVLTSRQESMVKLFKGKGCPKELENVGREISNKCKGLPLTVGLIAGLLEKVEKSEQMWREFLLTLNSHVTFGDGIQSNDAIELSYKYLADHLKPCLLYLAALPEDKEIDVSELIELWISEGFIEGMVGIGRVEDEAEDYLNHLVSSNLIMVSRKQNVHRIVILSCRVHDLVRDFCLTKAREEISMEIINNTEKKWDPTLNFTPHRICLHFEGVFHLSSELVPWNSSIHTILVFWDYIFGPVYNVSWIAKKFEHLTILDLEGILVHQSILSKVNSLIHLRYLALNVDGDKNDDASPLSLENLEYLIILKLNSEKVHFPVFFWNMRRLRHMSITGSRCGDSCKEKSKSVMIAPCSKELQTWDWPCSLTPNHECLLRELLCLKTLSCGVSSSESFLKIDFLHHLEKLELFSFNGEPHLLNNLKLSKFPSSVKEIQLHSITLSVSAISTIAQISNLETLVLWSCIFEEGLTWNVEEETKFPKLKRLKLFNLGIGIWNISSVAESFSCLEQLDLIFCVMHVMPSGFEDILTLKMISAWCCSLTVDSWVEEIQECARDLGNEQLQVDILCK